MVTLARDRGHALDFVNFLRNVAFQGWLVISCEERIIDYLKRGMPIRGISGVRCRSNENL